MYFSNLVYIIAQHVSMYCLINYPRVNMYVDYLCTDLDMAYFATESLETQQALSLLHTL
jgi:hypothetical protein